MGLFRNRNKKTISELEDYYKNQGKKSSLKAWFMAFLSLLITIVIIVLLFFGIRWLYRTLVNDNSSTNETTISDSSATADGELNGGVSADGVVDDSLSSSDTQTNNSTGDESQGTVSDEAASTSEPNSDRVASESDSNSTASGVAGDSAAVNNQYTSESGEITDTGPGEVLLITPLLAAVLGYYLSRKKQIKQTQD